MNWQARSKRFSTLFLAILFFSSCSTHSDYRVRSLANFQSCLSLMNDLIGYRPHTGPAASDFLKAKSLNELESFYGGESLIDIQRELSDETIKKYNAHTMELLADDYKIIDIPGKKSYLTNEEADVIYNAMSDSKVNKNHDCYDKDGTIGFCFGRATIAHLEAIVRDVNPQAIRKIWIAGDMGKWGHHVATIVKAEKGWYVLDTEIGFVLSHEHWVSIYLPLKTPKATEIMVFTTQAGRFSPYDTQSYNAMNLFNTESDDFKKTTDYYRGYFHDYFEDLDNVKREPLFAPK